MRLFPKAADYIRTQARSGKLTEIYDFELLEEILPYKTVEEYLAFKEQILLYNGGHVRDYPTLFSDWISGDISELDMEVYSNNFEPGQHLRYFRDFFKDTREEETINSKGTLIELRAYGQSLKIDREVIAFEGKFYDDRLSTYADKTDIAEDYKNSYYQEDNDLDVLPHDLSLLQLLAENNCLQCLDDDIINDILSASLSEQTEAIQKLSAFVRDKDFLYNESPSQFFIKSYHYTQLCDTPDLNEYNGYYFLDEILEDLQSSIARSYVLSTDFADREWTDGMKKQLKSHAVKDHAAELINNIEPIKKVAEERIALSIMYARRKRNRKRVIVLIVLLLIGSFSYYNYRERSKQPGLVSTSLTETGDGASVNAQVGGAGTSNTTPTGPGDYYLSETATEGAPLYRDVRKKAKLGHRLRPMDKIPINKIEADMGFFESYFDDNFNQVPKGWVEMKNLVPEEAFFTYKYGKYYRIKSDADRVIVYKDYLKKGKYRAVLSSMDRINVYKIIGSMAYFKDFYSEGYGLSGWVALDNIVSD